MKLIHLSDLHIGKRVNEVSMLEDQAYILEQILAIIDGETPDAVLIAGDVYDKTVPPAEAVTLFDDFLCRLSRREIPVLIVSGNHDSPERLAFGRRLMAAGGIHISPVYSGDITPVTLHDAHGPVHFWLLPFLKPAHVRRFFPEETIESYTDAVRVAVEHMAVDTTQRNVLLTHQFVTGAATCESEELLRHAAEILLLRIAAPQERHGGAPGPQRGAYTAAAPPDAAARPAPAKGRLRPAHRPGLLRR